jgi:hypothetical protein
MANIDHTNSIKHESIKESCKLRNLSLKKSKFVFK